MLTITHTFTAEDFDLIRKVFSRRLVAISTGRARWPFRLAYLLFGAFLIVSGMGELRSDHFDGLVCLAIGAGIVGYTIFFPLCLWFVAAKSERITRKRIGSSVNWILDDKGITFVDELFPWSKFRSFSTTEAGIVLEGTCMIWIPAGALSDPSVNARLQEDLSRHVKRGVW